MIWLHDLCTGFGDDGCARLPLFSAESSTEAVAMEWWEGGSSHDLSPTELGGIELFIVSGTRRSFASAIELCLGYQF